MKPSISKRISREGPKDIKNDQARLISRLNSLVTIILSVISEIVKKRKPYEEIKNDQARLISQFIRLVIFTILVMRAFVKWKKVNRTNPDPNE